ncbi:MAG: modification methylase, partial [Hyphomicrobiales bacterium]|nr:modification methylase [Hyphomicrobiales bacterium]
MHPVQSLALAQIKPNPRNARTHSKKQISQIAASIKAFGFTVPVLVNEDHVLLAGHGRLEAARMLGLNDVPAIVSTGLSPAQQRALMLADNKIAANAGWDRERLAAEIPELATLLLLEDLDISLAGFDPAEIDALVADFEDSGDPDDDVDPGLIDQPPVSCSG